MSDPSKHGPILFSTNAFERSEVEVALRAIRAEFAVDEVPLQRGGPDYFVIAFTMAYPLVAGILSSAIWDGIKVLVSRWRRKPSHYRPGETVDLGSEYEVPDGDITHGATISGSDPGVLGAALHDLAGALEPYHQRRQPAHIYYDLAERRFLELPHDDPRA